ncbi:hypothetical protein N7478_006471 [Penicillium angulare]|uniref:uncharacterized protein n=1 Tax=Penicillium angulare TaxID=116970 RepID=UPI002540B87B|nr:uncharacterized protein N7478_006471 [Penicillium angulare]KAJ5281099.1 hypothetical protein N7478_006471 [Penicillium angulare]
MASTRDRPTHFCNYQNAQGQTSLSSVVCVADLDPAISIPGAPRELKPEETQGMVSCGVVIARQTPLLADMSALMLKGALALPESRKAELCSTLKSLLQRLHHDPETPDRYRSEIEAFVQFETIIDTLVHHELATAPAAFASSAVAAPVGAPVVANKKLNTDVNPQGKVYCSYWLRHGECDYQQQGCLYKHEMPLELKTIQSLGLADIPRWYREKNHISSLIQGKSHRQNPSHVSPALAIIGQPFAAETVAGSNQLMPIGANSHDHTPNGRQRLTRGPGYPNTSRGRGNGRCRAFQHQTRDVSCTASNFSNSSAAESFTKTQKVRKVETVNSLAATGGHSVPNPEAPPFLAPKVAPAVIKPPSCMPLPRAMVQTTFAHQNRFNVLEDGQKDARLYNSWGDGVASDKGNRAANQGSLIDLVDSSSNQRLDEKKHVGVLADMHTAMQELRVGSTIIQPHEFLRNFGAIGEDVVYHPTQYSDPPALSEDEVKRCFSKGTTPAKPFGESGVPDAAKK